MSPAMVEYVALRLIRRFLFTDAFLVRFGRLLPYYRTNANQDDAGSVAEAYERHCRGLPLPPPERRVILEVGSGATNAVGYAIAQRGWVRNGGRIVLFEPYVALDEAADARMRAGFTPESLRRVERVRSLDGIEAGSVDLVLSNSVLEHVRHLDPLIASLARVLAPAGVMVHAVDYRDHFFKYPFHFLLFSDRTWERWLDPGDLPRWRLADHVRAFRAHGFEVQVSERTRLEAEFARVRDRIAPRFRCDDPDADVATAVLRVRAASPDAGSA